MPAHKTLIALAGAAAVAAPVAAAAPADTSAPTTLERSVRAANDGTGVRLVERGGQPRVVRRAPAARASARRSSARRSIAYFGQITDPQIADEASPARAELLAPARGRFTTFWRPHEALGPHALDRAVRSVNRNRTSPVPAGDGSRARMRFTLVTGDLADNAQRNELRWAVRVLDGGRVDPFSGRRISRRNQCPGASRAAIRRVNAAVGARRYTGVQDSGDWRGRPAPRYRDFWDPDRPRHGGRWSQAPAYPNLLDHAQRPFVAEGLQTPWYSLRGNHDAVPQGFFGPRRAHPRSIATGCRKLLPTRGFEPRSFRGSPWALLRSRLRAKGAVVAPDARRRLIASPGEFRRLHGRADRAHGFGFASRAELRRSRGAAAYYAFTPRHGLRVVALDTTSDASGPNGNLDHPQYAWLSRQLRAANQRRQLVIVTAHHSLETMNNPTPDEAAGRFDRDPRRSTPVHRGLAGPASVRGLLIRHPNVVMFLSGHVHRNRVRPFFRRDGRGFWQVSTAAVIDAPQQSRLIELMDNRDGTLSLFATLVDHSPAPAPASGRPAATMSGQELGSVARLLSASGTKRRNPHPIARPSGTGNVELVVRDPRRRR